MTFFQNPLAKQPTVDNPHLYMALVDELGQETPITEMDIRRSLKMLESDSERENQLNNAMDLLMERVYAARAIA